MILINLCLVVIFLCIAFLLLYRKIVVNTWARACSCFTLLGIVGVFFDPRFSEISNTFIWLGLAGLHIYITVKSYRRGYI